MENEKLVRIRKIAQERKALNMINRHAFHRYGGGLVFLIGMLSGCDSKLPVAETPPPPVTVSQPISKDVIDEDDYEGRIAAVDTQKVEARVTGYLDKVNFKDGQMVKPKELLFEIDPKPYKATLDAAEAQVAAADAALNLALKEYARARSLQRSNAASAEEVDVWIGKQGVAKAEKLKALAEVEKAKLELGFTKIFSPIEGRISRTKITAGNLVNPSGDTVLTTIVTVDPMYVYFDVDERALQRYKHDFRKGNESALAPSVKELKIPVQVGLEGETGYPHTGVIDFAENQVNASTGTIQVRGVIPNPKGVLDAGMRARVRVPVSEPHKSLLITERAVGTDQGRKFVYVVNDQKTAERRDVVLGRTSGGLQIVQEGLKPEDWVVVNGIQRIRDGAKVEPNRKPMPGATAESSNEKNKG
jgi:multidrug efflux system membrane fusion protein